MGRILSAFLMLGISSMCGAQIYKYLGIEDGLSNRRIYRIQKDGRGYMWFLTQEGMDRYDGKRIRHYTVLDGNLKVAPQVNLNWLYNRHGEHAVGCGKERPYFPLRHPP